MSNDYKDHEICKVIAKAKKAGVEGPEEAEAILKKAIKAQESCLKYVHEADIAWGEVHKYYKIRQLQVYEDSLYQILSSFYDSFLGLEECGRDLEREFKALEKRLKNLWGGLKNEH